MDQIKKDQNFVQQPGKKTEMPERGDHKKDISSGPRPTRPEIDLPLKSGRVDSELASKNTSKIEDVKKDDRNDHEKSVR